MLSEAPAHVPEVEHFLKLAVETWLKHPSCPLLDLETERRWDGYIEQWIAARDLPLFVRVGAGKQQPWKKGNRRECDGRVLFRCDNSPAQWIFRRACDTPEMSFEELRAAWEHTEIPLAMVPDKGHDVVAAPPLGGLGIGLLRWELSHRRPVRLQRRPTGNPVSAYEEHFRRLMSVSNMVLTPRRLGMNHLIDWYFRRSAI